MGETTDVRYYKDNSDANEVRIWNDKGVDVILNNVKLKLFDNNSESEDYKSFVRNFYSLYYRMKEDFSKIYRTTWERYFEHLREVTNNVLDLPHPNVEKVLTAIAHDSIEDVWKTFSGISEDYWYSVALSVQAISKDPWFLYVDDVITEEEKKYLWDNNRQFSLFLTGEEESKDSIFINLKNRAKVLRNKEYFSHMKSFDAMKEHIIWLTERYNIALSGSEIEIITQNTLDVKFADRIHNLSTQWSDKGIQKTKDKVEETKKYFLSVAKETNPDAYRKLQHEIFMLEGKIKEINNRVECIVVHWSKKQYWEVLLFWSKQIS